MNLPPITSFSSLCPKGVKSVVGLWRYAGVNDPKKILPGTLEHQLAKKMGNPQDHFGVPPPHWNEGDEVFELSHEVAHHEQRVTTLRKQWIINGGDPRCIPRYKLPQDGLPTDWRAKIFEYRIDSYARQHQEILRSSWFAHSDHPRTNDDGDPLCDKRIYVPKGGVKTGLGCSTTTGFGWCVKVKLEWFSLSAVFPRLHGWEEYMLLHARLCFDKIKYLFFQQEGRITNDHIALNYPLYTQAERVLILNQYMEINCDQIIKSILNSGGKRAGGSPRRETMARLILATMGTLNDLIVLQEGVKRAKSKRVRFKPSGLLVNNKHMQRFLFMENKCHGNKLSPPTLNPTGLSHTNVTPTPYFRAQSPTATATDQLVRGNVGVTCLPRI